MPNPGLMPGKGEWDVQRDHVAAAVKTLKRQGIKAGDFVWSQEPYRVRRRAGRPVYVITEDV